MGPEQSGFEFAAWGLFAGSCGSRGYFRGCTGRERVPDFHGTQSDALEFGVGCAVAQSGVDHVVVVGGTDVDFGGLRRRHAVGAHECLAAASWSKITDLRSFDCGAGIQ